MLAVTISSSYFFFCGSYSSLAFPLSRLMVGWRATEVEMICDEVAANRTSEPLEIAEALVKLRRQTLAVTFPLSPSQHLRLRQALFQIARFVFNVASMGYLPCRCSVRRSYSEVGSAGLILFVASLFALTAILLFAPLSVHHATETLIEILK